MPRLNHLFGWRRASSTVARAALRALYGGSPEISHRHCDSTEPDCFPEKCTWEAPGKDERRFLRLRQAIALPLYTVSLILDFASVALGRLAAVVAGDDWPG